MTRISSPFHAVAAVMLLIGCSACDRPPVEPVDTEPPLITLHSPQEGYEILGDSLVLEATVRDNESVESITYRFAEDSVDVPITAGPEVAIRIVLRDIAPGSHEVELFARDDGENLGTVRRTIVARALPLDPTKLRFREIVSGLRRPVQIASPSGDSRLFVLEQLGQIRIVENGALLPAPFLDLSSQVHLSSEEGLLGLAFHPRFADNGYLYVYYTDRERESRVVRFRVSGERNVVDVASAKLILLADQPEDDAGHHKAGTMFFGKDNMLYVALGDGAGAADFYKNAQNPGSLLGGVLRIDVDGGDPYAIPADNPYVGQPGARGEVWAKGLRNPWRITHDRVTGTVFIPDVGEDDWEELNVVPFGQKGKNFGWPLVDGEGCPGWNVNCNAVAFAPPFVSYSHADGCSIIGGVVYRGRAIPELRGRYLYTDLCGGFVRSLRYIAGMPEDEERWPDSPLRLATSFGEDGLGEVYVTTMDGRILALEPRQ